LDLEGRLLVPLASPWGKGEVSKGVSGRSEPMVDRLKFGFERKKERKKEGRKGFNAEGNRACAQGTKSMKLKG
jgi:hypothetical protein